MLFEFSESACASSAALMVAEVTAAISANTPIKVDLNFTLFEVSHLERVREVPAKPKGIDGRRGYGGHKS